MPRVLVVDDDPEIRTAIVEILQDEGLDVAVACDGRTALEMISRAPPDMIVLDVMMPPGMSGLEVLEHIRRDPVTARMPVLVVSGSGAHVEADECTGSLAKPASVEALLGAVRAALQVRG